MRIGLAIIILSISSLIDMHLGDSVSSSIELTGAFLCLAMSGAKDAIVEALK